MTKTNLFGLIMLALVVTANAQLKGIGYDANLSHITARMGLGADNLDVGAGMKFDNSAAADTKFGMSVSAYYLKQMYDLGAFFKVHMAAGGVVAMLPQKNDNFSIAPFVGLQPEIIVLDKLVLSTRFGIDIPVLPDFKIQTAGTGISIVSALNFKFLF